MLNYSHSNELEDDILRPHGYMLISILHVDLGCLGPHSDQRHPLEQVLGGDLLGRVVLRSDPGIEGDRGVALHVRGVEVGEALVINDPAIQAG